MQKLLSNHLKSLSEIVGYDNNGNPLEDEPKKKRKLKVSNGKVDKKKEALDSGKKKKSGGTTTSNSKKKSVKKESSKDDKKKRTGGGFQADVNLSKELEAVIGCASIPRTQVTKKIWEYIKGNNLQDPSNGRTILCNDALKAIFKVNEIDMFQVCM